MRVSLGYNQISPLTDVEPLHNIPTDCRIVLLQAETQDIRFRDDGTDPTATGGMLLEAGQQPYEYNGNLQNLRFIAATAGAILNYTYYRN